MKKVKYSGKQDVDKTSFVLKPGDVIELPDSAAEALVKERPGDCEIVKGEVKKKSDGSKK